MKGNQDVYAETSGYLGFVFDVAEFRGIGC
jgi:hypothetical protein